MTETQRVIVGGAGGLAGMAGIGLIITLNLAPGIPLFVVGTFALVVSLRTPKVQPIVRTPDLFIAARTMVVGEEGKIVLPDDGNSVLISDDLLNQGYIGPKEPSPAVVGELPKPVRRQQLRSKLDQLYEEGQRVLGTPVELIDFRKESQTWTRDVYEFLGTSLGMEQASIFYYQWNPAYGDDGSVSTARSAHLARLQVLGSIIERVHALPMREDWQSV